MKKTAEKVAQPDREKGNRPGPVTRKPQQPLQEKPGVIRQSPEFGTHKRVQKDAWQGDHPTERHNKQIGDDADLDELEEEETTA